MSTSITELPTYLRVELGPGGSTEMMETYREAAVRCLERGLTRALVVAYDGDPQIHAELRSTIRAMAMAGCAEGFRFALVAKQPATAAIYAAAAALGRDMDLDVRAFPTEEEAVRWLHH